MFFAGCESAAGRSGLRPLVRITDSFTEFPGMLTPFRAGNRMNNMGEMLLDHYQKYLGEFIGAEPYSDNEPSNSTAGL